MSVSGDVAVEPTTSAWRITASFRGNCFSILAIPIGSGHTPRILPQMVVGDL